MAAVLLSNPGLPLAVLGNPRRGKKRRRNPGGPQSGSSDTGASSSGDSPNRNTTQTGGSSPGGASTGGVASGLGGAGTGGAATGGASTGGAGTVTLTISGSSSTSTSTGGRGGRGGGGRGRKEKERPINISISNVGGRTDAGNVASGDGPGASGSGGRSKGRSSGGGGGGAAPDEPEHYSTGRDAKRLNHSTRTNPMSKRTPRFFLRRFKRGKKNPYVSASGYTAGGAFVGKPAIYGKAKADVAAKLAASGLDISSMTAVKKSGGSIKRRRKHAKHRRHARHHKKARRGHRKTHMSKKTRRRSAKRRLAALRRHSRVIGRVYSRKVRGKRRSVKILGVRKGHGKKRKVIAVRWSGKKGSKIYRALSFGSKRRKGTHVIGFTNPRRRKHRSRRTSRRNPGIVGDFVGGITGSPRKVMSLFKGPGMVKNVAFTAGGAIGSFMVGGILSAKLIRPLLEKVAPSFAAQVADPSTIQARLVGGLLPYTAAFAITKLFGKKLGGEMSSALLLGGAVASVVELIRPGMVGDMLKKVGLGEVPMLAGLGALNGPVCGLGYQPMLADYVQASSYQGQAGIVSAPAYQGSAGLRGYVTDGSQRLSGEVLAGTFLDDAADSVLTNNWLNSEAND